LIAGPGTSGSQFQKCLNRIDLGQSKGEKKLLFKINVQIKLSGHIMRMNRNNQLMNSIMEKLIHSS